MKETNSADDVRLRTHLFMVRIWLEDLGGGKAEWRGQVKHVLSGEVRYFREWPMLVKILQEALLNDAGDEQNSESAGFS